VNAYDRGRQGNDEPYGAWRNRSHSARQTVVYAYVYQIPVSTHSAPCMGTTNRFLRVAPRVTA